ncbi:unnamed protein product [Cunninghamella echinulata]
MEGNQDNKIENLYFECKSGILLWGHLHTILEGYLGNEYDSPLNLPEELKGGTIVQRCYNYRVKAKQGIWKTSFIYSRHDINHEFNNTGFIVYYENEDIDPIDITRRCSKVGVSMENTHSDDRIVYINRYDWSYHHQAANNDIADQIENILGGEDEYQELDDMFGSRLIVVDSESVLNTLDQLKECSLLTQPEEHELFNEVAMNCTLKENSKEVGVHLNIPGTEYEIGWLVYNNNDELIAIVYDRYNSLEGELKVDDKSAISFEEYNEIIEKNQFEMEEKDRLDIEQVFNNRGNKSVDIIVNELIELDLVEIEILVDKYKTIYNDIDNIIKLFNKKVYNN